MKILYYKNTSMDGETLTTFIYQDSKGMAISKVKPIIGFFDFIWEAEKLDSNTDMDAKLKELQHSA